MRKSKDKRALLREDESFPVYLPSELAALLGVTLSTLAIWRSRGRGPKFVAETPKSVVYLKATVDEWLRTHQVQRVQSIYHKSPRPKPKRSTRADQPPPSTESPGA